MFDGLGVFFRIALDRILSAVACPRAGRPSCTLTLNVAPVAFLVIISICVKSYFVV